MTINYKKLWELSKKSFFENLKWKYWKWLTVGGGIGIFFTFIQIIKDQFKLPDYKILFFYFALGLISVFVLRFFLILARNLVKYLHEVYVDSIFGDAIILLKNSFSNAHYYRKTPGVQEEEFMIAMMNFCDNLKDIFDRITNSSCSVSIKVPVKSKSVSAGTSIKTLTIDQKNNERETIKCTKINHTIIGNTSFSSCLGFVLSNNPHKHYIHNDVNNDENYANTSKGCFENYKLPYESEFVYPIVPIKLIEGLNECHGFICINSNIKFAFNNKYILPLIEGVADGIYDLFSEYNSKEINQNFELQNEITGTLN